MKKFITCLMLLGCLVSASRAQAQSTNVPAVSIQIASGTWCYGINVTTGTSIQVVLSTTTPHHSVYIENEDAAANLFASHSSGVTTSGAARGSKIRSGNNWKSWVIGSFQPWYVISDTISSAAMICITN